MEMTPSLPSESLNHSERFIGRAVELDHLSEAFARAREGRGGFVIVEGESGSGKSELPRHFLAQYVGQRIPVMRGNATAQSAPSPFQIFQGVAHDLCQLLLHSPERKEQCVAQLSLWQEVLISILPEFADVFGPHHQTSSLGPEDFGEERSIRALSALLSVIGTTETPAIIILDDLQWADTISLKTLSMFQRHLAASHRPLHALIIVIFRSDEVPPQHPLRQLSNVAHFRLSPFNDQELRSYLESLCGTVSDEVLTATKQLSGSRPFMAGAVLRGLIELGVVQFVDNIWRLESALRDRTLTKLNDDGGDFLAKRLTLLDEQSLLLLRTAAVIGKEFSIRLILEITQLNEESALTIIQELLARAFISPADRNHWYRFSHDKLRESVLGNIAEHDRINLHGAIALAMSEHTPDSVFEIAFHFEAAQMVREAYPYALKAGRQARAQHALELAERFYRLAERGCDPNDRQMLYNLSMDLGQILMLRGNLTATESYFRQALSLAFERMDRARAYSGIGELMFRRGALGESHEAFARALEVFGVRIPSSRPRLILGLLGQALIQGLHTVFPWFFIGRRSLEKAEEQLLCAKICDKLTYVSWWGADAEICFYIHLRALNCIELYKPTDLLATIWSNHAPGCVLIPIYSRAKHYGQKGEEIARAIGDTWSLAHALSFHGVALYAASEFSLCIEKCSQAVRLFERSGDPWECNIANANLAYALYRSGNLAEAIRTAQRTHRDAVESQDRQSAACALSIWSKASGGQLPIDHVKEAINSTRANDIQSHIELRQALGIAALAKGEYEKACSIFEEGWQIYQKGKQRQEYTVPLGAWYVTTLRRYLQQLSSDHPRYETIKEQLSRLLPKVRRNCRAFRNSLPHFLREEALLALLDRRPLKKAIRLLKESVAVAEDQRASYEAELSNLVITALSARDRATPESDRLIESARNRLQRIQPNIAFHDDDLP